MTARYTACLVNWRVLPGFTPSRMAQTILLYSKGACSAWQTIIFQRSRQTTRLPQAIDLGDPVAVVAALEAVIGFFIELILIATFSKRFLSS
jgi:hypothetical protein